MLGFSCVTPIKTVHGLLDQHGVLDLLRDPLITAATQEIVAGKRSRREIQRDIKAKERAIETLSTKYCRPPKLPQEVVRQALYSIGDNHAFLRTNRDPCDRMIGYLQQYFHPTQVWDKKNADSLAIRSGRGGARLSHDHARQYAYVMQSLALWREILHGAPLALPTMRFDADSFLLLLLSSKTCSTCGRSPSKTCSPRPSRTVCATRARA